MDQRLAAHLVSFGLDDREPYDATGSPDVVSSLRFAKLLGLARAAWLAGDLVLDDEQATDLSNAHSAMMAVILELDALLLRMLHEVGPSGMIVLKGLAHAHLDHDPSHRDYGDVDLYVSSERFAEVEAWFSGRGFDRSFAPFAPDWDAQFGKSWTLSDGRLEVDLHRNLSQGLALGVRPPAVFSRVTTFRLAAVDVPVLDAPARLVHAAIHALGGSRTPPLSGVCDLAHMAQDPLRVEQAAALARTWDVAATFRDAVRLAATMAPLPAASLAMLPREGSARERLRRRVLASDRRRFRHDVVAGLLSLRDPRLQVRYIRGLLTIHGSGSLGSEA